MIDNTATNSATACSSPLFQRCPRPIEKSFCPASQDLNWSVLWPLWSAGNRSISLEIRFIPHAMKEGIAEFLRPRNLLGGHQLSKAIPYLEGGFVSLRGS